MEDRIHITLRMESFKSDSEKLKRILKEMDRYKTSTTDKDEADRQFKEELTRRLREAGLFSIKRNRR